MRLAGHHALVTGGGTGIGAAIARALNAEGAKLTLVGRRREPLEELASELNGTAIATADVTDRSAVDQAMTIARDANGPLTILIANAGAATSAPFSKISESEWRGALAVNLDGVFHCAQSALPDLLEAEAGRLITIASTAGLHGFAYTAPYVAAKHGAVGLMRALAAEFKSKGMTANAICPGFTDTEIVADAVRMIRKSTGCSHDEARADLARFNPSGRLIDPAEIGQAVVELVLSDRNGEALEIA